MTEAQPSDADSTDQELDEHRSGLRNPSRAITGLGAAILILEALVLLLAIVPLKMLRVDNLGFAIGFVLSLTVAAIVLAGLIRRPWAWHATSVFQAVLVVGGIFINWSLIAVGLIFGCTWLFVLSTRKKLTAPPVRDGRP